MTTEHLWRTTWMLQRKHDRPRHLHLCCMLIKLTYFCGISICVNVNFNFISTFICNVMLTVIYFIVQRQVFHGMKEVKCKVGWYEVNNKNILMIRFCNGEAKSGWLNDIEVTAYMEYITKQSKDHVLHTDSLLMTQHQGKSVWKRKVHNW